MIQSKKALYDIPLNMTPQSLKKSLMPFNRVSKIVLLQKKVSRNGPLIHSFKQNYIPLLRFNNPEFQFQKIQEDEYLHPKIRIYQKSGEQEEMISEIEVKDFKWDGDIMAEIQRIDMDMTVEQFKQFKEQNEQQESQ